MAEVDALAQLKDIHLPASIAWWPLAPGWYAVFLLVLVFLAGLAFFVYRRYLNSRAKKQALVLLENYAQHYDKEHNGQVTSARISELLKRVALVYFPREQVASMHGQEWIDFLNQTGKGLDFEVVKSMLLDSPFRVNEQVNLQPLISQAKLWIKQRRGQCSN